jgi:FlaG/FlaF family flagellin (archaellin)
MAKGGLFNILSAVAPLAAIALPGAGTAILAATKGAELAATLAKSSSPTPLATAQGSLGGGNNLAVNYGPAKDVGNT